MSGRKLATVFLAPVLALAAGAQPGYIAGDFHQHSVHTDGSYQMPDVFMNANAFGLKWWANSEHGGIDATINGQTSYRWQDFYGDTDRPGGVYVPQTIVKSGVTYTSTFQAVLNGRAAYPGRTIIQGLELNPPRPRARQHRDHRQPVRREPQLRSDRAVRVPVRQARDRAGHPLHPEPGLGRRPQRPSGEQPRGAVAPGELSDAELVHSGPPGAPDRQRRRQRQRLDAQVPARAERRRPDRLLRLRVHAGSPEVQQPRRVRHQLDGRRLVRRLRHLRGPRRRLVGQHVLAEGRNFWLFASSDFHSTGSDFWPGEYQKTYSAVADVQNVSAQSIVDSLRSGNSYIVNGDLINELRFTVTNNSTGQTGQMGQFLPMSAGDTVTVNIRFKSPEVNNNGDHNLVNLVQLIEGNLVGALNPSDYANYICRASDGLIVDGANNPADVSGARVAKLFNRAAGEAGQFVIDSEGYTVLSFTTVVDGQKYYRIRGTNNVLGGGQVDGLGNPLLDTPGTNTAAAAWADLWFYSNPIGVPEPATALLCVAVLLGLRRR